MSYTSWSIEGSAWPASWSSMVNLTALDLSYRQSEGLIASKSGMQTQAISVQDLPAVGPNFCMACAGNQDMALPPEM